MYWLTSEGARLISSSSTQWPWRSALTRAPSWKAKAKPPSASWAALSADVTLSENLPHSSLHRTRMLLLRELHYLQDWQLARMACMQRGYGLLTRSFLVCQGMHIASRCHLDI